MTGKTTTYGIQKANAAGHTMLLNKDNEFMLARFFGIGARATKEWKTRKGAERAAGRLHGNAAVFAITGTMNYIVCCRKRCNRNKTEAQTMTKLQNDCPSCGDRLTIERTYRGEDYVCVECDLNEEACPVCDEYVGDDHDHE